MALDKYLIGLVVVAVVIISGIMIITDLDNNYSEVDITNKSALRSLNTSAQDTLTGLDTLAQDQKDATFFSSLASGLDILDAMLKGTFQAIRFVKDSFSLVDNLVEIAAKEIGIPPIFIGAAMTVIILFVTFASIAMIIRFRSG